MPLDYDPVLIVVKLSCVFGCHNATCPDGLKTVDVFPVGIVGFVFICLDVGNNCFVHKTNTHGRLPYIIAVGCSFSTDGNSLLDLILVICRKTSEMSIANSTRACVYCWLIVAYTAGGKALALFLVVSFWIIFCLTGRYIFTASWLTPSRSELRHLAKVSWKKQQKEVYCFVGPGNRIGHGRSTWRTISLFWIVIEFG